MRIERYTETFLDDAMRLCQYIAGEDGTIRIVLADPNLFPEPVKDQEFPDQTYAVQVARDGVTVAECAYLKLREDGEEDLKHHNRWLTMVKVGNEIRIARERKGMTQEDLAEVSGFRPHSIDSMERGRYVMDVKVLGRLAEALGCEIKLIEK